MLPVPSRGRVWCSQGEDSGRSCGSDLAPWGVPLECGCQGYATSAIVARTHALRAVPLRVPGGPGRGLVTATRAQVLPASSLGVSLTLRPWEVLPPTAVCRPLTTPHRCPPAQPVRQLWPWHHAEYRPWAVSMLGTEDVTLAVWPGEAPLARPGRLEGS